METANDGRRYGERVQDISWLGCHISRCMRARMHFTSQFTCVDLHHINVCMIIDIHMGF